MTRFRMYAGLTALLIDQEMRSTYNYAQGSTLASILLLLVIGVVVLSGVVGANRRFAR